MRIDRALLTAATAVGAVALLSACSSGGSSSAGSTLPGSSSLAVGRGIISPTGLSPHAFAHAPLVVVKRSANGHRPKGGEKDLFVSNYGATDIEVLANKTWKPAGTITNGITCPDGNWVDAKGNLYVANCDTSAPTVVEYAKGASSPTFTYSSGMTDPVGVTTDSHGNVYESDFEGGAVNEYAQGSNTVIASCKPPNGLVEAAAVSKTGAVFVASENGVVEYAKGLSGCSETTLGVTTGFDGGMVLDRKSDLVLCDQDNNVVDIIAPPYSSVTGTISAADPRAVTVNKKNNQAYIASYGDDAVYVDSYPAGTNEATLGSANGIDSPESAVDGLNYVP
ncbi:MAG: hypothetical protein JOZ77_12780 [Candidatus Eremiobacteraeota bacterium]|nr:hypothetical protein [Candidatus Eremiobacteraeota bacterium]